jgi:hypothetical protein
MMVVSSSASSSSSHRGVVLDSASAYSRRKLVRVLSLALFVTLIMRSSFLVFQLGSPGAAALDPLLVYHSSYDITTSTTNASIGKPDLPLVHDVPPKDLPLQEDLPVQQQVLQGNPRGAASSMVQEWSHQIVFPAITWVLPEQDRKNKKKKMNVPCSRGYFCNTQNCRQVVLPKNIDTPLNTLQEMEDFIYLGFHHTGMDDTAGGDTRTTTNSTSDSTSGGANNSLVGPGPAQPIPPAGQLNIERPLRIQFWGDSISATMECDLRQWQYEVQHKRRIMSPNNDTSGASMAPPLNGLDIDYIELGCPWAGCEPKNGWDDLKYNVSAQADVIIFNLGAHYELFPRKPMSSNWANYEKVLKYFVEQGGRLIMRSPSPTHFATHTGLGRKKDRNILKAGGRLINTTEQQGSCAPFQEHLLLNRTFHTNSSNTKTANMDVLGQQRPSYPFPSDTIARQDRVLREMADRLNTTNSSYYLDVYGISWDRWSEHILSQHDCKHFCQSCGLLRAWNAMAVSLLLRRPWSTRTNMGPSKQEE